MSGIFSALLADHLDIITVQASETRNQNTSVSAAMASTQTVTCISLKLAEYTLLTSESRFSFKLNTLPGDMTHLDAATI